VSAHQSPPPSTLNPSAIPSPLIAVINNDPELINMLVSWFEAHGMRAISASLTDFRRGHEDFAAFVVKHDPKVIVLDVGMPYQPNWDYVCVLRLLPQAKTIPMVLTTGNKAALEKTVGATDAHEIYGHPEDLTRLADAVRAAALEAT
jgi:CheY-like chemotaxis protein